MDQVQFLAAIIQIEMLGVNLDANLIFEKITHPKIMIPRYVVDGDSSLDQIVQHEQNPMVIIGNGVLVLKPEIEQIA